MNSEIIHRLQTTLEMDDYVPVENVQAESEFARLMRMLEDTKNAVVSFNEKLMKSDQPPSTAEHDNPPPADPGRQMPIGKPRRKLDL